jgi:hypothetical protein
VENWGFWLFSGKNALRGKASTIVEVPGGRMVLQKDPLNPAVLEDEFIIFALRTSRQARADFNRLFPTMLPEEQERLTTLLGKNKRATALLWDDQAFYDMVQHRDVVEDVRPRLAKLTRTSQIAADAKVRQPGGGV